MDRLDRIEDRLGRIEAFLIALVEGDDVAALTMRDEVLTARHEALIATLTVRHEVLTARHEALSKMVAQWLWHGTPPPERQAGR